MSFALLSYEELLKEITLIGGTNFKTLNEGAVIFESANEMMKDTDYAYFIKIFDGYRSFFKKVEGFIDEIGVDLKNRKITLGLVERMTKFGDESQNNFLSFQRQVDKSQLNQNPDYKSILNDWYELIANNLRTISDLSLIAEALNTNFRYLVPFNEIGVENIAIQSKDGITITKDNELYIDGQIVLLAGQRKKIMLLLIQSYIDSPSLYISWMNIESEIRTKSEIEREDVVSRVSALRTRLKKQGFDSSIIEIENVLSGVDASWRLVKKTSQ